MPSPGPTGETLSLNARAFVHSSLPPSVPIQGVGANPAAMQAAWHVPYAELQATTVAGAVAPAVAPQVAPRVVGLLVSEVEGWLAGWLAGFARSIEMG
jgi:hypothetical protein